MLRHVAQFGVVGKSQTDAALTGGRHLSRQKAAVADEIRDERRGQGGGAAAEAGLTNDIASGLIRHADAFHPEARAGSRNKAVGLIAPWHADRRARPAGGPVPAPGPAGESGAGSPRRTMRLGRRITPAQCPLPACHQWKSSLPSWFRRVSSITSMSEPERITTSLPTWLAAPRTSLQLSKRA